MRLSSIGALVTLSLPLQVAAQPVTQIGDSAPSSDSTTGLRGVDEFTTQTGSTAVADNFPSAVVNSVQQPASYEEPVPPISAPQGVSQPQDAAQGLSTTGATALTSQPLQNPVPNAVGAAPAESAANAVQAEEVVDAEGEVEDVTSEATTLSQTASETNATLAQPPAEPNLWQGGALVGGVLLSVALFGTMLVRLKRKGKLSFGKTEKDMFILSTLPISPKRQVILIKIRNQEIALASTEQGITFLTEVKPERSQIRAEAVYQPQLEMAAAELPPPPPSRVKAPRVSAPVRDESTKGDDTEKNHKSEIFMQALKSLKSKPASSKVEVREDAPASEVVQVATPKKSPTMTQTRGNFPKYLANAFEKEQKRSISTADQEEESVESVTNMIREKLKSLGQANS